MQKIGLLFLVLVALVSGCMPASGQIEPGETRPAPEEDVSPGADTPVNSETPDAGGALSPLEPLPDEGKMTQGEAFVNSASIEIMESFPVQIVLVVSGTLPTPCHKLRMKMNGPDAQNRIELELYSLVDPETMCVQMLEFFEERINLGAFPSGEYQIYLNGELVGEFVS